MTIKQRTLNHFQVVMMVILVMTPFFILFLKDISRLVYAAQEEAPLNILIMSSILPCLWLLVLCFALIKCLSYVEFKLNQQVFSWNYFPFGKKGELKLDQLKKVIYQKGEQFPHQRLSLISEHECCVDLALGIKQPWHQKIFDAFDAKGIPIEMPMS